MFSLCWCNAPPSSQSACCPTARRATHCGGCATRSPTPGAPTAGLRASAHWSHCGPLRRSTASKTWPAGRWPWLRRSPPFGRSQRTTPAGCSSTALSLAPLHPPDAAPTAGSPCAAPRSSPCSSSASPAHLAGERRALLRSRRCERDCQRACGCGGETARKRRRRGGGGGGSSRRRAEEEVVVGQRRPHTSPHLGSPHISRRRR
mmetsp:Transcript_44756/g.149453  ORF Transcript_44756/g.149453 Transcript_44756/m.149453 type:complete len:204 (+) Transcript_44756:445-1056(+)